MSAAISTLDMSHEDWLAARRTGIGGSDAAAVVGLSPYKTPYEVWLDKTGQSEPEDLSANRRVKWGIRLEDSIADGYAEETGRQVRRVNRILRHPEYPFILANIDREIVGAKAGLECKNVGDDVARFSGQWGPSYTDQCSQPFHIQCQHYMLVTGKPWWELAALIGGNDLRIYPIMRDDAVIEMLLSVYIAFWNENVLKRVAPDARSIEEARLKFPKSLGNPIEATDEVAGYVDELRSVTAAIKTLTKEKETLQGRIGEFMGENDTLTRYYQKVLTWKSFDKVGFTVAPSSQRPMVLAKEKS